MFSKILIANRSEVARRVIRTCSEMGIATIVVFTEHDVDAPFVSEGDEAVALPGDSSYLDIDTIVKAALLTGADAIHPGYGFLAERADFAAAVEDAGITFIGPTPETIASMGSKLHARDVVHSAGVPVLPIAELGSGIDAVEAAGTIGYPVLVKASSGGGGKGMRIVAGPADLDAAIEGAAREAASAFGDGTVYLERYVESPRHIEVQIVGDGKGNVVHLYERECSIQRRFQKVIEEAPAVNLDLELKRSLWDAAVAAGEAVDYRGAGTVEFIVGPDGEFAFLEMNTRLQVEHPVTELTTGVDLVRMQIEIAAGTPMLAQVDVPSPQGHAIEARLYAELPADGYLPSTGVVHRFAVPAGVRVDSGIVDGVAITHHYDPMVAKIISHAPTRNEAAVRLVRALTGTRIHGVGTNRDLLVRVLSDDSFLAGRVDTHFLERKDGAFSEPLVTQEAAHLLAVAAAIALQVEERERASVLGSIPSGWRNVPFQRQTLTLRRGDDSLVVAYRFSRDGIEIAVNEREIAIDAVYRATPEMVDVAISGLRRTYRIHIIGEDIYVDSALGSLRFEITPRLPDTDSSVVSGGMVARTPGAVVAVPVAEGDVVTTGDTVMVIEAMKMEQAVVASEPGRVAAVHFAVGDHVDAGAVLVEIEPGDQGG